MTRRVCWQQGDEAPARGGRQGFRLRPFPSWSDRGGPRTKRPRAGVSLLELLIVLTTLSVLLTTSTVTLVRLLRAQSAGSGALAESLTTSRLARDLRRDARAATAAEWDGPVEGGAITLSHGNGGRVRYSVSPTGVRRTSTPTAGPGAVEDYVLPAATVAWGLVEGGRLIALRITRSSPSAGGGGRTSPLSAVSPETLVIEAAVGRAAGTFSTRERP
jgi:hypothetical protein